MFEYYPLANGNTWEYQLKDGTRYTNEVVSLEGNVATMKSSMTPDPVKVKVENGVVYNELMASGNYQPWIRNDLKKGDTWEVTFVANGLNSIMAFIVKDTGISKVVNGTTYDDVILLEAESKINMNGNVISTNFFTQYFYAKAVGLIMTTSSLGDEHSLIRYSLN